MFQLHPQLAADCMPVGGMGLCQVLLMNDVRYPWFILVPEREGITEIYQLSHGDQLLLIEESSVLARTMERIFRPDKLNIAALGNMVPQLHIHHIARFRADPAWPAPVWGRFPAQAYQAQEAQRLIAEMRAELGGTMR